MMSSFIFTHAVQDMKASYRRSLSHHLHSLVLFTNKVNGEPVISNITLKSILLCLIIESQTIPLGVCKVAG